MLKILIPLVLLALIATASAGEITKAERNEAFNFGSQNAALGLCPDTMAISNVVERSRLIEKVLATETDPAWVAASAEGSESMPRMYQSFSEIACGFAAGAPDAFIDLKYGRSR